MEPKFNLPFSLGLPDAPPSGMPEQLKEFASEFYNAFQQIQLAVHSVLGVGQQLSTLWASLRYDQTLHQASPWRYYAQASENIAYGAAINLHVVAGVIKLRNANATNNTKPCHGFCTTEGGIAVDEYGEAILMQGLLTGVSGLTLGVRYFLSTSNGQVTSVAPVAAGNIEQPLGIAVDTTALLFCFPGFYFVQH